MAARAQGLFSLHTCPEGEHEGAIFLAPNPNASDFNLDHSVAVGRPANFQRDSATPCAPAWPALATDRTLAQRYASPATSQGEGAFLHTPCVGRSCSTSEQLSDLHTTASAMTAASSFPNTNQPRARDARIYSSAPTPHGNVHPTFAARQFVATESAVTAYTMKQEPLPPPATTLFHPPAPDTTMEPNLMFVLPALPASGSHWQARILAHLPTSVVAPWYPMQQDRAHCPLPSSTKRHADAQPTPTTAHLHTRKVRATSTVHTSTAFNTAKNSQTYPHHIDRASLPQREVVVTVAPNLVAKCLPLAVKEFNHMCKHENVTAEQKQLLCVARRRHKKMLYSKNNRARKKTEEASLKR